MHPFKFKVGQLVTQKENISPREWSDEFVERRRKNGMPVSKVAQTFPPKGSTYKVIENIEAIVTKTHLLKLSRMYTETYEHSWILPEEMFE